MTLAFDPLSPRPVPGPMPSEAEARRVERRRFGIDAAQQG
jgi:hypothetical protein